MDVFSEIMSSQRVKGGPPQMNPKKMVCAMTEQTNYYEATQKAMGRNSIKFSKNVKGQRNAVSPSTSLAQKYSRC